MLHQQKSSEGAIKDETETTNIPRETTEATEIGESTETLSDEVSAPKNIQEKQGFSAQKNINQTPYVQHAHAYLNASGYLIHESGTTSELLEMQTVIAAKNSGRMLSGTLDQMQKTENGLPVGVVFFDGVKILIPYEELFINTTAKTHNVQQAIRKLDLMLGAKIDFMVKGYDLESSIAVASRSAAMKRKRELVLLAKNDDGQTYRINEESRCTVRVIRVHRKFAIVELYGLDITVPSYDLSDLYTEDIRDVINTGDELQVSIKLIERSAMGAIKHVEVTSRTKRSDDLLDPDKSYTGVVTSFSASAFYVSITGTNRTLRCPITINRCTRPISVGDTVRVFIHGVWENRETGGILRIIKKGKRIQ